MNTINWKNKMNFFFALLGLIVLGSGVYFGSLLNSDKIYKGVSIGQIDVSNLSKFEAKNKLISEVNKNLSANTLNFEYGDKKWSIPYKSIDAKYNFDAAVNKAYAVGREGNIFSRISNILSARKGKKFDAVFAYDKAYLTNEIKKIKQEVDSPKKNATFVPGRGIASVVPHIVGKSVNVDKAVMIADGLITKLSNKAVKLPVDEEMPDILDIHLKDMKDELGSFSTAFNLGDKLRANNIRLACSRINGTILKPGELFSIDKTIKNRTVANGYKTAKAYFQDEVVEEIGGGVCQVTTTLYDAALLSDLSIVERRQHSMMVDYVSPGFDAAVSDKGVDLKFKNNKKFPIYLYSGVESNRIVMKVYGKKTENKKIVLETEVTDIFHAGPDEIVFDHSLPKGVRKVEVKSRSGYRANLYKSTFINDAFVKKELVSKNLYKPRVGKILVGI